MFDDASPDGKPSLGALLTADIAPEIVASGGRFVEVEAKPRAPAVWDRKQLPSAKGKSLESANHQRTRIASVINMPLWNRANWCGMAFCYRPETTTPYIDLMVKDADAGAKILRGWKRRIGVGGDPDEAIRIAVLTGIDKANPAHYRVGIAPESSACFDETQTLMFSVRMHTMTPETTTNLDWFLERFRLSGRFRLGASVWGGSEHAMPTPLDVEPIEFRRLDVKAAWQVEEEDPLFTIILQPGDDPYIPPDVENPGSLPVNRVLEERNERKRQRS